MSGKEQPSYSLETYRNSIGHDEHPKGILETSQALPLPWSGVSPLPTVTEFVTPASPSGRT